jgi:hypothetical protein
MTPTDEPGPPDAPQAPEAPPEVAPEPASEPAAAPDEAPAGWLSRHGADVGLAVLAVYVVLLAIGTVAELFDIQWILDWPIY